MATILKFRRSGNVATDPAAKAHVKARPAEIIIFPGVRIERHVPRPSRRLAQQAQGDARNPAQR